MRIKNRYFFMTLIGMVLLTGCAASEKKTIYSSEKSTGSATEEVQREATDKPLVPGAANGQAVGDSVEQGENCLRIYLGEISSEVSPFFCLTDGDKRLLDLLYMKASGQQGEETQDEGAAEVTVKRKGKKNTVYRITIRDNVRDRDGNQLTADDLLFNYYLRCRLDYQGMDEINQMNLVGLEEYQYGAKGKKLKARKKKVKERISYPTKKIAKKICQEIILPALKEEYAWVESLYQEKSQKKLISKYPQASMLFARFFAPDTTYTGKGKSKKKVLREVAEQYGGDIKKLSKVTGEDYTEAARCLVIGQLWPKQKTGKGKIAGIQKKNDTTLEIRTTGFRKKDKERLGNIYLISKGTQSGSKSSNIPWTEDLPLGFGIYFLEEKTEEGFRLASNQYYQKGSPQIGRIQIVEGDDAREGEDVSVECARKITDGELDMAIIWERISKEKESLKDVLEAGDTAWKVAANGGVLYSTERINATTMPDRMTATDDVLKRIGQLKLNT